MYVGIIGARTRNDLSDYILVQKALEDLMTRYNDREIIIVSGGANRGGDRFAKHLAMVKSLEYMEFRPEFRDKDASGFFEEYYKRNRMIAFVSDELIACVHNDGKKGGTGYTIDRFKEYHPETPVIEV